MDFPNVLCLHSVMVSIHREQKPISLVTHSKQPLAQKTKKRQGSSLMNASTTHVPATFFKTHYKGSLLQTQPQ